MSEPTTIAPPATTSVSDVVLQLEGVRKVYRRGVSEVAALGGVDLSIGRGEMTFILGPSGSGKSTLLHLLGALDQPTGGCIRLEGVDVGALDDDARTRARRERIGFVFQSFHLLDTLDALGNVLVGRVPEGVRPEDRERARRLLERVGLGDRLTHRPTELSGGEQQRVAIARALFRDPPLILADEPTGELDTETGRAVLTLLRDLVKAERKTVVIVTHDASLLASGDRVVRFRDGRIASDERVP